MKTIRALHEDFQSCSKAAVAEGKDPATTLLVEHYGWAPPAEGTSPLALVPPSPDLAPHWTAQIAARYALDPSRPFPERQAWAALGRQAVEASGVMKAQAQIAAFSNVERAHAGIISAEAALAEEGA